MPGHVFHPGHQELHGITVIVETQGTQVYVGRFDSQDDVGVHMLDVGVFDAAGGGSKADYLERSARFGIRADHKHVLIPGETIAAITRLAEFRP